MTTDVLILGGGLIGITTAHRLAKRGYSVTVVEAKDDVGIGANYANGAMLVPSQSGPWNTPGILSTLVKSLLTREPVLRVRLKAIPSFASWGMRFLHNSRPHVYERNLRCILNLALYSMDVFEEYYNNYHDQFNARKCGTIKIFRDYQSLEAQITINRHLDEVGLEWETLTPKELAEAEPHLQAIFPQLAGGISFPADIVADSRKFCQVLRDDLIASGHVILKGWHADELIMADDKVLGARTKKGDIRSEITVLALGAKTGKMMPENSRSIFIRPVKGYSITYDTTQINDLPALPVIDEGFHVGVVPLNRKLRVVGIADFAGFDSTLKPQIIRQLDGFIKRIYPGLGNMLEGCEREPWSGFRAMSADSLPYIGQTTTKGLWVNTGHGHLGWTLAAGSAELLTDLITKKQPAIDTKPFAVHR